MNSFVKGEVIMFQSNHWSFRIRRFMALSMVMSFLTTTMLPPGIVQAQGVQTVLNLPISGSMIAPTPGYLPAVVKGVNINVDNPLEFNFIVDTGDTGLKGEALEEESSKLIKYFLAAVTVPEDELWVNLSPYEDDRIIPQGLGQTEMGRDLLAQDYMLKQLTASLMYPEKDLGQKFWQRVHQKAQEIYGTTDIPMNTFNKVWIVPKQAIVYEHDKGAYILESKLEVMLEEDYFALRANLDNDDTGMPDMELGDIEIISGVSSEMVREILIPEIEKEVNEGKTFAPLRQIYHSMILAMWYKETLKDSLLGQVYADQNKVMGVDVEDKEIKQKIYDQYLEAFNKGVYDYIREDYDPVTRQNVPKKYFSGGFAWMVNNPELGSPISFKDTTNYLTAQINYKSKEITFPDGVANLNVDQRRALQQQVFNTIPSTLVTIEAVVVENIPKEQEKSGVTRVFSNGDNAENNRKSASAITLSEIQVSNLRQQVVNLSKKLNLSVADQAYSKGKVEQAINQWTNPTNKKVLRIGENFIPTFDVDWSQVKQEMGIFDYAEDLKGKEIYIQAASEAIVEEVKMNAGLGSSVKRKNYLEALGINRDIAAKSQDLFHEITVDGFDVNGNVTKNKALVSVNELKYLQAINKALKQEHKQVIIQELVNNESEGPLKEFLDTVYLLDKYNNLPNFSKRTYRDMIRQTEGLGQKEMMHQGLLPTFDIQSKELISKHLAPGGHGQLGVMAFYEAIEYDLNIYEGAPVIRVIENGDGVNNTAVNEMVGAMIAENIPIAIISTDRMSLDKKVGIFGFKKNKIKTPTIQERAQAVSEGQEKEFDARRAKKGDVSRQLINTNMPIINITLLQPLLKNLKSYIGDEKFSQIVSPDLILNEKKDKGIYQLEGALVSAILNLNDFLVTNEDLIINDMLKPFGGKLVYFFNVDPEHRIEVFSPNKFSYDHWLYENTDHFSMGSDYRLINNQPDHLPELNLDEYYLDMQNARTALGVDTKVLPLDSLTIKGMVELVDPKTPALGPELSGNVWIDASQYKGVFNLVHNKGDLKTSSDGRLMLKDVIIVVDVNGIVSQSVYNENNLKKLKEASSSLLFKNPILGVNKVGGINLNPDMLDLQIKRDRNGVPLPLGQQPIYNMRIDGFYPVILNIQPVTNLPMLLGSGEAANDDGYENTFDYDEAAYLRPAMSPMNRQKETYKEV